MAQSGMTQGGFYRHFQSKDALIAEACMSAFNRSAQTWKEKGRQRGESLDGALQRLIAHRKAGARSPRLKALFDPPSSRMK